MPPTDNDPDHKVLQFRKVDRSQAAGIFTWALETDTAYVDAAIADCFGFGEGDYENGLPIKRFLQRMHPDDVGRIAKSIHDTILTGEPYQENYRICRPDGSTIAVSAFGSCFRDARGEPVHYAGIIVPMISQRTDDDMVQHFMAALESAKRSGNSQVVQKTMEILEIILGMSDRRPERPRRYAGL